MRLILTTLAITLFASPTWGGQHDNMITFYGKDANEVMTNGEILSQVYSGSYSQLFTINYKDKIYFCEIGNHDFYCRTPIF